MDTSIPKRRQDGERTRQVILAGALTVFAQSGLTGASIKGIAEASGVSQPLILHHFAQGKAQLWAEVKRQAVGTFASSFRHLAAVAEPTEAQVRGAFFAYFSFCVAHPELMRLGLWIRATEGTGDDWGGEGEVFARQIRFAEQAQSLGLLRRDVPVFDLLMIFSGAIKSWIFDGQHFLTVSETPTPREALDQRFFESAYRLVVK